MQFYGGLLLELLSQASKSVESLAFDYYTIINSNGISLRNNSVCGDERAWDDDRGGGGDSINKISTGNN